MKCFFSEQPGRQAVIYLQKGEDIKEGVKQACDKLGIRDASINNAIGSASHMSYHYVASCADDPENIYVNIDKACEIGSIQGMVLDGDVHLHVAFSDKDGNAYNGHMESGCIVLYLLEINMTVLDGLALCRRSDDNGINYIDQR
ncbi:MAG: DNA-binding protein [Eubacteriales bacterium]|nr:DNA-binding protein [Eubacteriales bacterium]